MLASSSRLDLNVVVGPVKPRHIKTILSSNLPIHIDYPLWCYRETDATGSAVWRMHAALKRRDRVREISVGGYCMVPSSENLSRQPITTFLRSRALSFTS